MYMREVRSRKLKEKKRTKKNKTKQKKKTTTKKNTQRQRQKLGQSRFNSFFKVIESRNSFGGVRERVPEAGGRRDKRVEGSR